MCFSAYVRSSAPLDNPLNTLSEMLREATQAKEEAEEKYLGGDFETATHLLQNVSEKWTAMERAARSAVVFEPEAAQSWAVTFEDAQHAVARARATLGSFYVAESLHLEEAIELLTPSCPSLWFFSRRASPGEEHVRGEVAWARCYRDLLAAHKFQGESKKAHIIERDVVAHSTTWLRAQRDAKSKRKSTLTNPKLAKRRAHDLYVRWPPVAPKLRAPRTTRRPPKTPKRLLRNEKRVETLFYFSELSALSASERAITARDFGRAKTKAKTLRRDLEALAEALAEAGDALHRAKVLAAIRDARDRLARDLTPSVEALPAATTKETSLGGKKKEVDDDDDEEARWNAGVALAAMLRATRENNNENDTDLVEASKEEEESGEKTALEAALDAFVHSEASSEETFEKKVQQKFFGAAFGRHVLAEANEYVAVAAGVHAHGWGWLQREAARLEDEQRRSALAIAPAAGPPPGFASRYDVVHVMGALKTAAVKRADLAKSVFGSNDKDFPDNKHSSQTPKKAEKKTSQSSPKKKKKRSLKDDIAAVERVAPSTAMVLATVVVGACARGTVLLREQQRKENDGYSKRRPKRNAYEWARDLVAHLALALGVAFAALLANVKKSVLPSFTDDLRAAKSFCQSAWRSVSLVRTSASKCFYRQRSKSSSQKSHQTTISHAPFDPSPQQKEVVPMAPTKKTTAAVSPEVQKRSGGVNFERSVVLPHQPEDLYHAVSTEEEGSDSGRSDYSQADEWQPVPKGGRVVGVGPRLLSAASQSHLLKSLLREQEAISGNVGTSAVDVLTKVSNPEKKSEDRHLKAVDEEKATTPTDAVITTEDKKEDEVEPVVPAAVTTAAPPPPQAWKKPLIRNSPPPPSDSSTSSEEQQQQQQQQQRSPALSKPSSSSWSKNHKMPPVIKIMQREVSEPLPPPKAHYQQTTKKPTTTTTPTKSNKKTRTKLVQPHFPIYRATSPTTDDHALVDGYARGRASRGGGQPRSKHTRYQRGGYDMRYQNNNTGNAFQQQQQQQQHPNGGNVVVVVDSSQLVDPEKAQALLLLAIRRQVEYYFSVSNLCKDVYLRNNCMDDKGFVLLSQIATFKRVSALTTNLRTLREALVGSEKLEVLFVDDSGDCKVRTKDQPERWTSPFFKDRSYDGDDEARDLDDSGRAEAKRD